MNYFQFIIDYFNELPFVIQLASTICLVLVFAVTVLTIYLKTLRSFLRKKDLEIVNYRKEYETLLIEYLYSNTNYKELNQVQRSIITKLKKDIKIESRRKSVITVLSNLMEEVTGELSDSIKILYHETGLLDFAILRLNDKNWHIVAKAISELTRFEIKEAHHIILKFINHPRSEVQKETQLYLVNMFRFKGLSFLNDLKLPLSEWHQVQLLETLQKFDDQQICDIKPWLKSTNTSVVAFALKLAKIYNQFEVKDNLIEMLSHYDKDVRVSVIEILAHLYGIEAKDILKTKFDDLHIDEQIEFFRLLDKLKEPKDEPFIEKHLFHDNFEIQVIASKILKSINIEKFTRLNNLMLETKASEKLKLELSL